jgi:hypothetical protein
MPTEHDPTASMSDEQAYDKLYDAAHSTEAAARYSDAKEAMRDAIGLARWLGQDATAVRLEAGLAHIEAVFRSQLG